MPSRILGIDPGYGRMGLAVIERESGKDKLIHSECFETKKEIPHPERLAMIKDRIENIFREYKPSKIALETILWSKNTKTAIGVAEARGVILAEAAKVGMEIEELNPNSVKLAITGYGKGDKKQVMNMLQKIIEIKHHIKHDDEYDAIAIAIASSQNKLSPIMQ